MDIKKYSGKAKRITNNHTLSQSQQQIITNAPRRRAQNKCKFILREKYH